MKKLFTKVFNTPRLAAGYSDSVQHGVYTLCEHSARRVLKALYYRAVCLSPFRAKFSGLIVLLVFIIFSGCSSKSPDQGQKTNQPTAIIKAVNGEYALKLEIADTPEARAKGLMNRKELNAESAMLFVWQKNILSSFWMKDTPLSLDILFMNENLEINHIVTHTTPFSPELITPSQEFFYALEVKSGFVESSGVKVGDKIELKI